MNSTMFTAPITVAPEQDDARPDRRRRVTALDGRPGVVDPPDHAGGVEDPVERSDRQQPDEEQRDRERAGELEDRPRVDVTQLQPSPARARACGARPRLAAGAPGVRRGSPGRRPASVRRSGDRATWSTRSAGRTRTARPGPPGPPGGPCGVPAPRAGMWRPAPAAARWSRSGWLTGGGASTAGRSTPCRTGSHHWPEPLDRPRRPTLGGASRPGWGGCVMRYYSSSGSSAFRARAIRFTPSGRLTRRTPMVCRCARRTSAALVRMTTPSDVIA